MLKVKDYEDVTQITMGAGDLPLYLVSSYLVDGMLVDTGCPHTADELFDFLKDKNLKFAINTHYHEDHIGANHHLLKELGIKIYAHPDSIPLINQVPELYPYQELVWGYPVPTVVLPIQDIVKTDNYQFSVIETPGHCNGHISLVEFDRGWCFLGDLFVSEKPRVIRPEENLTEIIRSMNKLLDLDTKKLVLFASNGKIVEEGRNALKSCIRYLKKMAEKAKNLNSQGLSINEIVQDLFGGEQTIGGFGTFKEMTQGQFSTENLVKELLKLK